jgi:hypothetical protein
MAVKYTDAAHELSKNAPEAFAHVSYNANASTFTWAESYAGRAGPYKRHFYELVSGFRNHLRLLQSQQAKIYLLRRFANGIGNSQMAAELAK